MNKEMYEDSECELSCCCSWFVLDNEEKHLGFQGNLDNETKIGKGRQVAGKVNRVQGLMILGFSRLDRGSFEGRQTGQLSLAEAAAECHKNRSGWIGSLKRRH